MARRILTFLFLAAFAWNVQAGLVFNGEFNVYKPGTGYTVMGTLDGGTFDTYVQGVVTAMANLQAIQHNTAGVEDADTLTVAVAARWVAGALEDRRQSILGANHYWIVGVEVPLIHALLVVAVVVYAVEKDDFIAALDQRHV